jgi:hypothetical protein
MDDPNASLPSPTPPARTPTAQNGELSTMCKLSLCYLSFTGRADRFE